MSHCLQHGACRLQYPPLGACEKLAGSAAHGVIAGGLVVLSFAAGACRLSYARTPAACADFAGALYQSYVQEKDAGSAKAAENTALQEEVCCLHTFEADSRICLTKPMHLMTVLLISGGT